MDPVREGLEAALRARWDRETLAVYADHLEAAGETRGELISIDLRIDETGATPELVEHRKALILKWFGFQPAGCRHGFVDIDASSADPIQQLQLLDGPASPFVRSIIIVGAPKKIAPAIAKLSETVRPWLVKLVIRQWDEAKDAPTITASDIARLLVAAPNLATVAVDGRRVFDPATYPSLRSVRISGVDAFPIAAAPALESIDFAFHAHLASTHEKKLAAAQRKGLWPAAKFPKVTSLDLSRNLPGYLDPDTLGGGEDVFAFLGTLDLLPQLVDVRLPAMETVEHEDSLRAALARAPKLRVTHAAKVVAP